MIYIPIPPTKEELDRLEQIGREMDAWVGMREGEKREEVRRRKRSVYPVVPSDAVHRGCPKDN